MNQNSQIVSYPNGQKTSFSYYGTNNDERLQQIQNLTPGAQNLSTFAYAYDADGQITNWTQQVDTNTSSAYNYTYDAGNQVISAVLNSTGVGAAILKQFAYGYDLSGNRTSEQIGTTTSAPVAVNLSTYNIVNQLTNLSSSGGSAQFAGYLSKQATVTVAGNGATVNHQTTNFTGYASVALGTNTVSIVATDYTTNHNSRTNNYQLIVTNNGVSETLAYDLNGNLTNVTTATYTNTYEWDAADRLTAVNEGGTNRSEFTYDGTGRRVEIAERNPTSHVIVSDKKFLWCGTELCEERDSTGATVTKRFFGQGEQMSGTNYFFTRDHLGSVREMTGSTGTIHARYDYDPYGRETKLSGDLAADFGFTGHYYHANSGLYLTLYRAYDSNPARWLSRDPSGEANGMNLYAYVANSPINGIDPLGLWNLWNPATWGVPTGAGTSIWNSLNPLDPSAGWGGFSLEAASEGDAAFLDGINPFGNPFANMGLYDPCDPALKASKFVGSATGTVLATLPTLGLAEGAAGADALEQALANRETAIDALNAAEEVFAEKQAAVNTANRLVSQLARNYEQDEAMFSASYDELVGLREEADAFAQALEAAQRNFQLANRAVLNIR